MASAPIAQAHMLAGQFEMALKTYGPKSTAVFGCAGGNGFERIDPNTTQRVVAIDINADYIEKTRQRFGSQFTQFEILVADVQSPALQFAPVELIYAALVFEYVDVEATIKNVRRLLAPDGTLVCLLQLPTEGSANVSLSPYQSLQSLENCLRLVPPDNLCAAAEREGFTLLTSRTVKLTSGKGFQVLAFR